MVTCAIDSALQQTLSVREIIVIDDGSSDGTVERLRAYGSAIRVLSQTGLGASEARNAGVRAALGKWIAFLDDDDVWHREKIERQMSVISSSPKVGLVYCSDYAVDHELRILFPRTALEQNRGDVFEKLLMGNFIFTSCVLVRKEAITNAGLMDPAITFCQDWDLWLRVAASEHVDFASEPLVFYRQSPTGCLTREVAIDRRIREMSTVLSRSFELRTVPVSVRRRALHLLNCEWASTWLQTGLTRCALPHLASAIINGPLKLRTYKLLAHAILPSALRTVLRRIRPDDARQSNTSVAGVR
jgi:glycosyltransferase involved in cell wall biosynthesis